MTDPGMPRSEEGDSVFPAARPYSQHRPDQDGSDEPITSTFGSSGQSAGSPFYCSSFVAYRSHRQVVAQLPHRQLVARPRFSGPLFSSYRARFVAHKLRVILLSELLLNGWPTIHSLSESPLLRVGRDTSRRFCHDRAFQTLSRHVGRNPTSPAHAPP